MPPRAPKSKPAPTAFASCGASLPLSSTDVILRAAEDVILDDGIGAMSLDAVARRAGLSKSGLLHHFHSKDAMIDALVHRKVDRWKADYTAAIEAETSGPGRVSRAFLGMCLGCTGAFTEERRRSGLVLVAALVHDPRHVEPMRRARADISRLLDADRVTPGVGEAVRLAIDGLWFGWIFGINELTPRKLETTRAALTKLVDLGAAEAAAPSRSKPRAARTAAVRKGSRP